jgi:hypothetical protein
MLLRVSQETPSGILEGWRRVVGDIRAGHALISENDPPELDVKPLRRSPRKQVIDTQI